MWDGLGPPWVNILFTTKLLSLAPFFLRYGLSPDLVTIIILCSLGNGYCTFGFLIFLIIERNFLYYSLYILTEKSLKHLCSIRAWVPVSVCLFFLSSDCPSLPFRLSLPPSPSLFHFLIFDSRPPGPGPLKDPNTLLFSLKHPTNTWSRLILSGSTVHCWGCLRCWEAALSGRRLGLGSPAPGEVEASWILLWNSSGPWC